MKKRLSSIIPTALVIAVMCSSIFVSCEKESPETPDDPGTEVTSPDLKLNDTLVEASAEGGRYEVSYNLTHPTDGAVLSVKCTESTEWIGTFDTSVSGTISFDVQPNEGYEDRDAQVEVRYSVIDTVLYFRVTQQAPEMPDYDITVTVDQAIPTVIVTPMGADPESHYMVNALSSENFETLGFDMNDLAGSITSWWQNLADDSIEQMMGIYGYSKEEAINVYCQKSCTGATSHQMIALKAGLDHVAFVQQIDIETAQFFGDVTMKEFTNGMPDPVDLDVAITISDITANSAKCTIESFGEYPGFVAGCDYAADFEGMSDEEILDLVGQPTENQWAAQWSIYYGTSIINYRDLEPGTEYVVLAYSIANGVACSDLFKTTFTTLSE